MPIPTIHPSTYRFLKDLAKNNNRDWFNARKDRYLEALENVSVFVDALIMKMNTHDSIETPSGRKSLYRIYNDVRFSTDKTPYTAKFSGHLKRTKPHLRGGYYFRFKPGASRVACGFAYPNPDDLKRIRQDIDYNYEDWYKILKSKQVRLTFGAMLGDQVKSAPKGYSKDHPAIELLRFKQFWFERNFTDDEVLAKNFLNEINKTFKAIRPYFDYMTDVLTTDVNGEPIL